MTKWDLIRKDGLFCNERRLAILVMSINLIWMLHCPVCSEALVEFWKKDRRAGWICECCIKIYKIEHLKNMILKA